MMTGYRLTILLGVVVVMSAVAVIYSGHSSRQSFIAWQDLLKQGQDYEVEWGRLLIEKSTLASYVRLESKVSSNLKMVAPAGSQIVIVQDGQK